MHFTATHSITPEHTNALLALAELHNATLVLNDAPAIAGNPFGDHHPADVEQTATWYVAEDDKIHLTHALCELGLTPPNWEAVDAENNSEVDYVAATAANFPPLIIGNLFIARNNETCTPDLTPLSIPVNSAFGSGEHATTSGCLLALQELLATNHTFPRALDFGCGSAILALAFAKLTGNPVLAVDNDPLATARAAENAEDNHLANLVTVLTANTPTHSTIHTDAPYPLIFANVLLGPLLMFAEHLTTLLAPGGFLILSGITTNQETDITSAYPTLKLHHRHEQDGWLTLTFVKR